MYMYVRGIVLSRVSTHGRLEFVGQKMGVGLTQRSHLNLQTHGQLDRQKWGVGASWDTPGLFDAYLLGSDELHGAWLEYILCLVPE